MKQNFEKFNDDKHFDCYNNRDDLYKKLIHIRDYKILDEKNLYLYDSEHEKYIQIFLCNYDKLDMSYFYKSYDKLKKGVSHIIFIYNIATIQIKKLKMYKDILKIEFFNENELRRLLIGNRLIPKHSKVSDEEKEEIFKKFGKNNLPFILNTDPIVKLHDFDMNSVLEIQRNDAIYYRLVVYDD